MSPTPPKKHRRPTVHGPEASQRAGGAHTLAARDVINTHDPTRVPKPRRDRGRELHLEKVYERTCMPTLVSYVRPPHRLKFTLPYNYARALAPSMPSVVVTCLMPIVTGGLGLVDLPSTHRQGRKPGHCYGSKSDPVLKTLSLAGSDDVCFSKTEVSLHM